MTQIKNQGDVTAYIPTDSGGAYPLEPGASVDVRPGTAEFAANNIPGVVYSTELTTALRHGIAEAGTEGAIRPIAEFVEANPGATRYAPVGDAYGIPGEVTVVDATAIDPVVQADEADTTADPIVVGGSDGPVEVQTAASQAKSSRKG